MSQPAPGSVPLEPDPERATARGTTWSLVGTGAVAAAFAARLTAAGHLVLVFGRDRARAEAIAARAGPLAVALRDARELGGAPALVLAVSDGALEEVARELARAFAEQTPSNVARVALHTSGARSRDVLEELVRVGFATGSLHPLASLAPGSDGATLAGAWFAVDGDPRAVAVARRLARVLGQGAVGVGETVAARELVLGNGPDDKLRYHAAASLVAGGVVGLLALAEEALVRSGATREDARAALGALARGALENVAARGPSAALTGPAARGDVGLVRRQLAVLEPEAARVYAALLPRLAALGHARGSVSAEALRALLESTRGGSGSAGWPSPR